MIRIYSVKCPASGELSFYFSKYNAAKASNRMSCPSEGEAFIEEHCVLDDITDAFDELNSFKQLVERHECLINNAEQERISDEYYSRAENRNVGY